MPIEGLSKVQRRYSDQVGTIRPERGNAMQRKHLLIGALVALPLLAIGGVSAFAASGGASGTSRGQAFIADVASHLGISTSTLTSALQQARLDQVRNMLKSGRITSSQATRMENAIKSGKLGPEFRPGLGGGMRHGGPRLMAGTPGAMRAAVSYLGLTRHQLRGDLQSGKSLSDIASATSGKTVQGLEAAITSAIQQELGQAVTDGRMTQTQATNMSQNLQTFVQRFVTRRGFARGPHRYWGGPGPGGQTAPAPNGASPGN